MAWLVIDETFRRPVLDRSQEKSPCEVSYRTITSRDLETIHQGVAPRQASALERILKHYAPGKVRFTLPALYSAEGDGRPVPGYGLNGQKMQLTLLALPTLGFQVPGLDRWVKYEVAYKKVDTTLLGLSGDSRRRLASTYYVSHKAAWRRRRNNLKRYRARRNVRLHVQYGI